MTTKRTLAALVLFVALLAQGAEPPAGRTYHLAGNVSANAVIDMSKGPPCVSSELTIARGVTLTIAEGTTLQINHMIKGAYGSRLVLMPGVTVRFGEPKGSLNPGMNLYGALEIRGTKERPVNVHGTPDRNVENHINVDTEPASNKHDVAMLSNALFNGFIRMEIRTPGKITLSESSFANDCAVHLVGTDAKGGAVAIVKCTFSDKSSLNLQDVEAAVTDSFINNISILFNLHPIDSDSNKTMVGWPRHMDRPNIAFRRCGFNGFTGISTFHCAKPLVIFAECNLAAQTLQWENWPDSDPEQYMTWHNIPKELVAKFDPQTHKNILFRNCYLDPQKKLKMTDVYPAYESMVDKPFPEIRGGVSD